MGNQFYIKDFRKYLREEYEKRHLKNPMYSKRSFSRDCGLAPSTLTDYLSGNKSLSASRIESICLKLGLDNREIEKYTNSARETDRMYEVPVEQSEYLENFLVLTILLAIETSGKKSVSTEWLVQKVDFSREFTLTGIEKLASLGFLQWIDESKTWTLNIDDFLTVDTEDLPGSIRHKFVGQALDEVRKSYLQKSSVSQFHDVFLNAIDSSLLPEFKRRIKSSLCELITEFEQKSVKKDHVYMIQGSFVPLTRE